MWQGVWRPHEAPVSQSRCSPGCPAQIQHKHRLKIKKECWYRAPSTYLVSQAVSLILQLKRCEQWHQIVCHASIWMKTCLLWETTQKWSISSHDTENLQAYSYQQSRDTLTHIIHRAAHVGNSIFTTRQGEALPYSTQSRETITREGGRRWRAVREQSGSVLPPDDLRVKGRTQSALCALTVPCRRTSPSTTVGMILQTLSSLITLRCMCLHWLYLSFIVSLFLSASTVCLYSVQGHLLHVCPSWMGGGILFLLFSPPDEGSFLGRRKESLRINVVACCTDCKALWGKNCHKWFWAINITDLTIIFRPIRDPWGRCWHRYQEVKMWYISAAMHTLSQRSLTYGF